MCLQLREMQRAGVTDVSGASLQDPDWWAHCFVEPAVVLAPSVGVSGRNASGVVVQAIECCGIGSTAAKEKVVFGNQSMECPRKSGCRDHRAQADAEEKTPSRFLALGCCGSFQPFTLRPKDFRVRLALCGARLAAC